MMFLLHCMLPKTAQFANKLFNTKYYEIKILTLNLIFTPYCYDRLCFNLQETNSYSTFIAWCSSIEVEVLV